MNKGFAKSAENAAVYKGMMNVEYKIEQLKTDIEIIANCAVLYQFFFLFKQTNGYTLPYRG
jgi:hypothetical protein